MHWRLREGKFYPPSNTCLPALCSNHYLNHHTLYCPLNSTERLLSTLVPTILTTHFRNGTNAHTSALCVHAATLDNNHHSTALRKAQHAVVSVVSRSCRIVHEKHFPEPCLHPQNSTCSSKGNLSSLSYTELPITVTHT